MFFKCEKKLKIRSWIALVLLVGFVFGVLTGCSDNIDGARPDPIETVEVTEVTETDEEVTHEAPVSLPYQPENDSDSDYESKELTAAEYAEELGKIINYILANSKQTGSWRASSKDHTIDVNSILNFTDDTLFGETSAWNFNDIVAVGISSENTVVTTSETEMGIIATVVDNDTVHIEVYNHKDNGIKPVKVTAEMFANDIVYKSGAWNYDIKGYSRNANGLGIVRVEFSNGKTTFVGVLAENGQLWVCNINSKRVANKMIDYRLHTQDVMDEYNVCPDNATFLDIHYPIVVANAGEKRDTEYWIAKSDELVEDDWTDAHKLAAIYEYVIDNFAYDYWIVNNTNEPTRWGYHKSYDGSWYISKTHIGVCQDFAGIIAIMCRAQNIPAVTILDHNHEWVNVWIEDYNRWVPVDSTPDTQWSCYSEDPTVWKERNGVRFAHLDCIKDSHLTTAKMATIGNPKDMEKYGVSIRHP